MSNDTEIRRSDMYLSARETADKFNIKLEVVRNMCHARGQKFAYRLVPNGKFYIDPVKFQAHIERKTV